MCGLRRVHRQWLILSQLEYDTERAGTFEPLKFLPRDRTVVLGLISSKFAKLEDAEELKHRVGQAVELIANGHEKRSKEEALNQSVSCVSAIEGA